MPVATYLRASTSIRHRTLSHTHPTISQLNRVGRRLHTSLMDSTATSEVESKATGQGVEEKQPLIMQVVVRRDLLDVRTAFGII